MLRITDQGKTVTLTRQADGAWRDTSYFDLPADFSKLASFVGDLTTAKLQRLVTTSPDRLARLEFKDTKIEFLDLSGKVLWSVTLGKTADSGGRFVRFGDEPKAYLANLNAWLDLEPKNWADASLLSLKPEELAKVDLGFEQGTPVVVSRAKKDDAWKADPVSAGETLKADKISSVLTSLGALRFSDTSDLTDPAVAVAKKHARTVALTTFDGKTYTVTLGRKPEEKKLKPVEKKAEPAPAADKAAPAPDKAAAAASDQPPADKPAAEDKSEAKPAAPAKPPEPEYETIPAGPVYVWISSSDSKAPINALMQKRAFQVEDYIFTGLPQLSGRAVRQDRLRRVRHCAAVPSSRRSRRRKIRKSPRNGAALGTGLRSVSFRSGTRLISASRWSEARQASAMIVSVGFLSALEQNGRPIRQGKRFFTSHVCPQELVTEERESKPMIAPPTPCLTCPPGRMPPRPVGSGFSFTLPPIASISAVKVVCMCTACRTS